MRNMLLSLGMGKLGMWPWKLLKKCSKVFSQGHLKQSVDSLAGFPDQLQKRCTYNEAGTTAAAIRLTTYT
jgi:hypothetical protein